MRDPGSRVVGAISLLVLAASALAGEVRLTRLGVKDGAAGDTVTVAGTLEAPADVTLPATVEFRCGLHDQTLPADEVVQTTKSLSWKAPKGTKTGIQKFSLSLKTGKFSLAAKGIDTGDLADPLPLTLDIGGQRFTALLPLKGRGSNRSWSKRDPLQGLLEGRVLRISHALGNTVLTPASDMAFVRDDAEEEEASVVGGSPVTDADGNFSLTIEYTDPSVLSRLDLGSVLGEEASLTRPGHVSVTAGDDGVLEAVCFVEKKSGKGGTVSATAASTFEVTGANGAPSGTLDIPQGAVTADAPGLSFTPYAMAAELPGPLPDGYVALAGAEVKAPNPVSFVAAKAPTLEVSRPRWTEKGPLSTADIRLLQFRNGQWEEQAGRGIYNPLTDRFIPDPSSQARLAEASPVLYAAKVSPGQMATVRGKVVDKDGAALSGRTVLSRAGGTVSGKSGSFRVPKSTVTSSALEVVQVVGAGTTSGRVLTASEASAGEVTVEVAETAPPDWMVGVVLGTVTESGGGTPAVGATVTLSIAGSVRGLLHDDAGTADNFADDTFAVPDLASLGVTSYEWALSLPGQETEFVSTQYTSNTVSPTLLMLEAQTAGRTIPDGAYTVRVAYTIPSLGGYELFGGFRVTSVGIDLTVSDIQVPAGFEGTPSVQVTTNASGQYMKFYRAPQGIPMTASAVSSGGNNTNTRTFTFDSIVTVDLEVDGPPPPDSIPIGWSVRASMPTRRTSVAVVPLNGKIYVTGGATWTPSYGEPRTVEIYNPSTDTWATGSSFSVSNRIAPGGAAAGGLLYAMGGDGIFGIESYDPLTDAWSTRAAMNADRSHFSVGVINGKFLAPGGKSYSASRPIPDMEEYDPQANSWRALQSLPIGIRDHSVAAVDGILYSVGGDTSYPPGYTGNLITTAVWAYSTSSTSWSARADLPVPRASAACGVIDGEIYIVGGFSGSEVFSTMYIYNPATDKWRRGPDMPNARVGPGAAVVGGVLYVVGGSDPNSGATMATLFAYRPK